MKVGDMIELRYGSRGELELALVIKMRQELDSWEVSRLNDYVCDVLTLEDNRRMPVFADEISRVISDE